MTDTTADHEARGLAREALIRIGSHEKRCDERMIEIRDFHREIRADQHSSKALIVTTLMSVVGFLFCRVMGWV